MAGERALPPGHVAQPVGGGEHEGVKWELNRVYDPAGRLDHDRTYWEVRRVLGDDPQPRPVAYAEVAPAGVAFARFTRLTTPLAEVERWLELARRRAERQRERARAAAPTRELALG